jgi:hypothetical protein
MSRGIARDRAKGPVHVRQAPTPSSNPAPQWSSRPLTLVLAALSMPALAQPMAPITATPLLPPSVQQPQATGMMPSPVDQAPAAPQGTAPTAPQPVQQTWVPQGGVQLQVLDKANAQNAVLTVKVGQEAQFGSLKIQVQDCKIHLPDQPQDSAAYLTITDSHGDAPGFRGWMLANTPSVSMLEHPIYDVRVVGCNA